MILSEILRYKTGCRILKRVPVAFNAKATRHCRKPSGQSSAVKLSVESCDAIGYNRLTTALGRFRIIAGRFKIRFRWEFLW